MLRFLHGVVETAPHFFLQALRRELIMGARQPNQEPLSMPLPIAVLTISDRGDEATDTFSPARSIVCKPRVMRWPSARRTAWDKIICFQLYHRTTPCRLNEMLLRLQEA